MKKLFVFFLIFATFALNSAPLSQMAQEIEYSINYKLKSPFKTLVTQIYNLNGKTPLWVDSPRFSQALAILSDPTINYLNRNYNKREIRQLSNAILQGKIPPQNIIKAKARLDVMVTDGVLHLLHFLRIGDTDWNLVQQKLKMVKERQDVKAVWEMKIKSMPTAKAFLSGIKKYGPKQYFNLQIPLKRRFVDLVRVYKKYQKMPHFSRLHEGRTIRVGMSDDRVSQIRKMLKFFGDYPAQKSTSSNYYDRTLANAVRSFRERFKLPPGNYVDNKMIYYLNKDKNFYLRKILVNLEKLRLYPRSFESTYVEVNVPEYKMRFYVGGRVIFSSDVVVGRIDRPTPIFSSKMSYMVLNPTWTIPDNLIKRDLIPALKKNPDYLAQHNIHVYRGKQEVELNLEELFSYQHKKERVPYRFVQFPSKNNALGRVKFMFPNRYSVYLHDTDNRDLFKYRYRVFSSGCMRVARPFGFMHKLLRFAKGNYSPATIKAIFDSNKPTTIKLKRPIPVHILYFTVNKVGRKVYFLYDIYLYDKMIWESMVGHKRRGFTVPRNRLDPLRKPRKRRSFFGV
jgi:murein L,D-transpeptidase YcbB/YkuD